MGIPEQAFSAKSWWELVNKAGSNHIFIIQRPFLSVCPLQMNTRMSMKHIKSGFNQTVVKVVFREILRQWYVKFMHDATSLVVATRGLARSIGEQLTVTIQSSIQKITPEESGFILPLNYLQECCIMNAGVSLVKIMTCCLGVKPLSKPMMTYLQSHPAKQTD